MSTAGWADGSNDCRPACEEEVFEVELAGWPANEAVVEPRIRETDGGPISAAIGWKFM